MILFQDNFQKAELITNEFAFWNPTNATAVKSPNWDMTSGSLFRLNDRAWSGVPDTVTPNATSSNGTNSAVFRLTTKRADFLDYAVSFTLNVKELSSTTSTPKVDWDGIHVFLRYISEQELYYASVCRRDGKVVIKKKKPGGTSNGGTYYDISTYQTKPFPTGVDVKVKATIQTIGTTVKIQLFANGVLLVEATDTGAVGGAPILTPGKTGIRGDNASFMFDSFTVESL
tara:strand:+ start:1455 stop:2141 length:687 start_codon:yes stop_codon:yes gene_type:complete